MVNKRDFKMKEEKFKDRLEELGAIDGDIKIGVYYFINKNGDVLLDIEEMRREFENKITNIKGLLE